MNCVLLLPLRFGGKISILNHPMKKNNTYSKTNSCSNIGIYYMAVGGRSVY